MVRALQTDGYGGFCAFFSVIHQMAIIVLSVCFFPVLLVFIYIYLDILKIACSHQKQIYQVRQAGSRTADQHGHRDRDQQQPRSCFWSHAKALRTVAVLVGCFLVLWSPFFVVCMVQFLCKSCQLTNVLENYLWLLGLSNSLINPLLYAFWQRDVRLQIAAMVSCFTCRLSAAAPPSVAERNDLPNVLPQMSVPNGGTINPSLLRPIIGQDKAHTAPQSATTNV